MFLSKNLKKRTLSSITCCKYKRGFTLYLNIYYNDKINDSVRWKRFYLISSQFI